FLVLHCCGVSSGSGVEVVEWSVEWGRGDTSNPTPYYNPIVSTTSPNLTPFEDSDFLLKEVDAFLSLEDDPTSPEVDQSYFDSEGDILLLKAFLNDDPSLPPPNQGNYLPQVRKELKICEAKTDKSLIDEPRKVELKDLPPHLEYAFLEGDDKLPVIIAKYLSVEEKTALITVLKSRKRAIAWKLFDIKGIDPEFYTSKILMEDDFEPAVQHQRRANPKIHNVIKNEVLKLLDAGLIYPISDSPWARLLHWVLLLQEFTFKVVDTKGDENLAADHLSGLENPHQNVLDPKEINESFHLETFNMISFRGNSSTPWFANLANYHAGNFVVKGMPSQQKNKNSSRMCSITSGTTPFCLKFLRIKSSEGVYTARKPLTFSRLATMDPQRDIMAQTTLPRRYLTPNSIGPLFTGRSHLLEGTNTYSWLSTTCENGSKQKRFSQMTPELFANSLNLSLPDLEPPVPSSVIEERTSAMTSL
nr:reverse transcriptase domain-containing protein [Tanacetum cinerariifolium]